MYTPNLRGRMNNNPSYLFQDGGQMQQAAPQPQQGDEQQMVQQILQAIQQLSPEGQQLIMQALTQQ